GRGPEALAAGRGLPQCRHPADAEHARGLRPLVLLHLHLHGEPHRLACGAAVSGATTKGRWAARLLAALAALALTACDAFIDVDATANVPPRYVRVLVTVDAIWFHEDADAPLQDK